jgi:hypothetical protein
MKNVPRVGAVAAIALIVGWFGTSLALGQSTAGARPPSQRATVILAVDMRELTSVRDIPERS